ncbi:uncharacterized protein BDV17DRAFT_116532 [Aspergillus undulatus]|uniref:uncharacterized protein n=1 Tax=Aspergillus undulatus TaxID=1810928 RepID=UPI003CCDFECE
MRHSVRAIITNRSYYRSVHSDKSDNPVTSELPSSKRPRCAGFISAGRKEVAAQHRPCLLHSTSLLSTCLVNQWRWRRKGQARLTASFAITSIHNLATAASVQQQGNLERPTGSGRRYASYQYSSDPLNQMNWVCEDPGIGRRGGLSECQ